MVSCSMYGAIFTVLLEVSLSKYFTNVGRLLLLIDTLAPLYVTNMATSKDCGYMASPQEMYGKTYKLHNSLPAEALLV